jgi:putative ABC transport system permease protein
MNASSLSEACRDELLRARRLLARQPSFWMPAVAALAVGVGALTAVFAVVYAVLLRPLPYPQADRLVRLRSAVPASGGAPWGLAKAEFLYFERVNRSFSDLGLYSLWSATAQAAGGACRGAEEVLTAQVSAGLPGALGVLPTAGRPLVATDERPPHPEAAWLSQRYWARCYGSDPAAVGRALLLDGRPVTIVGILPPEAMLPEETKGPDLRVDLWVPLHLDPSERPVASHVLRSIGRLRPGVTLDAARRELARLTARLPEVLPDAYSRDFLRRTGFSTQVVSLQEDVVGGVGSLLWLLFATAGLVLVVAAADVASLVLARANSRRMETLLCTALGATRRRLFLHFLSESLLVSCAAGVLGFGLAATGLRLLAAYAPGSLPRLQELRLSAAAGFAGCLALALALALGLLPFTFRERGRCVLSGEGRHCTLSRKQRRTQHALIAGQVALSLLLLSATVLLLRSFRNLTSVQPGFASKGVLTFRVVLPKERYSSFSAVESFYRRLAQRLQALPGTVAVGSISSLPLTGFDGCSTVYPDTPAGLSRGSAPCVPTYLVSPGYFEAMQIPVRGDSPAWPDLERRAPLAVVSRALAQRLWPGASPLSRTIEGKPGTTPYRVAAIAGDVRANGLDRPPVEALYLPFVPAVGAELWSPVRQLSFAVRSEPDSRPVGMVPAIRRAAAEVDPQVPVADVSTMDDIVDESLSRVFLLTTLVSAAACVALLLALIGIYGLLTYLLGHREPEIRIRMALGAEADDVSQQFLRESLAAPAFGVVVGGAGFLVSSDYLKSYLYGVGAMDWPTLVLAAALLMGLATLAGWLPARRATRIEPSDVLRKP